MLGKPPRKTHLAGFGDPPAASTANQPGPKLLFSLEWEKPFFAIPVAKNLAESEKIGHYDGMKCDIEIFLDGMWRTAAFFEPMTMAEVANGIQGAGFLDYDVDYAAARLAAARPAK